MHPSIKYILQRLRIYHPLQSFYRNIIFSIQQKKYRKQYARYAGSGFACNACGCLYKKFVPDHPAEENEDALEKNKVIAGYGENIFCPNCLSTARERLVIAVLNDKINIKDKNILHLSPEKNIYEFIKNKALVVTADLLPGFYKTIDGLVQKQDATALSFANESFGIVIGNHILEHIPDDMQAMKEIYRVLKPGGTAILQVPYSQTNYYTIETPHIANASLQSKLYGQKDHVRIYSLNDYISRLESAGFSCRIIPYKHLEKYYCFAIQEGECFLEIVKAI